MSPRFLLLRGVGGHLNQGFQQPCKKLCNASGILRLRQAWNVLKLRVDFGLLETGEENKRNIKRLEPSRGRITGTILQSDIQQDKDRKPGQWRSEHHPPPIKL